MENVTFSTKKNKETPKQKNMNPPKPPYKSCPPVSRIKELRKTPTEKHDISFLNKDAIDNVAAICKHYKNYDDNKEALFFEQCFVIEGHLGCGSYGKVCAELKNRY
jgi:membrane-associated tyrosine/threonine-specific cdc2-inhibitory kinase